MRRGGLEIESCTGIINLDRLRRPAKSLTLPAIVRLLGREAMKSDRHRSYAWTRWTSRVPQTQQFEFILIKPL